MLTEAQRRALIDLARQSVVATVIGSRLPTLPIAVPDASGVFVTIKRNGELRGCLGTLDHELAKCRTIVTQCGGPIR